MESPLALYTSDELISELFSRSTFIGVLISSKDEHRVTGQVHNNYQAFSTLSDEQMVDLLSKTTEGLKAKHN